MNISLAHQPYPFKIKMEANQQYIFDIIRKKYVMITPEEWVRQHIVWYFIEVLKYPKSLISVEKKIVVNNLNKRYDVVVYDLDTQPWMLVECKAPNVVLSENTLSQLWSYQRTLQCPYGVITNGPKTYCCEMNIDNFKWLETLPKFENV